MQSVDVFYYALAVGFIILSCCAAYACYELGNTLKALQRVIYEVEEAAHDVNSVKSYIKSGIAKAIGIILSKWGKGGD